MHIFLFWMTMMIGKDKSADSEFPIPHNSVANHEVRENQYSSQYTASTSNRKHGPAHLVLNNFLMKGTNDNSISVQDSHRSSCEDGEKNTHSNFLYVYFFFSYYLCLTPFRLKKTISPGKSDRPYFEIHEFLPQKIICGFANLLAMVRYSVELRRYIQDVRRDNPVSFFKLFEGCSGLVFKTIILRCFWTKQKRFLRVVRFLDNEYIVPYNNLKMESIPTIACLCTFYLIIGFVRMITGSGFLLPSSLTLSWWGRRLVAEARYSFFLSNESHLDQAPSSDEISTLDGFLAVITGFTFQCRFIAGYFVDVGILLCVLTLWAPVSGFTGNIKKQISRKEEEIGDDGEYNNSESTVKRLHVHQNDDEDDEIVLKQYKALKQLTQLISEANGANILPFISEAVFGYAIYFEEVLITKDFSHRLIFLCFYFCAVSILVFSADVCRKMQCMKSWLWYQDRFSNFPSQKLLIVLHDLSTNAVGITASGIFTVDFYLVGSMISVLITLFIIRLQYQSLDGGG
ncbi:unnamed protein product [Orchesella dallaii]|uniref:Gustatory receptor n=1 Tax=Orchesella dallaii TaxID=48710 RepID=A0ABP1Q274_9HEXA